MKQPRILVIPHTKEDKKAKLMEEFVNYMFPTKVVKKMVKQVMLEEMVYRVNPLGLIKTYWKESKESA